MNSITLVTSREGQESAVLRAAEQAQAVEIAGIWHAGWANGHLGHVPDELLQHRTAEEFERRAAARIADTTVAIDPTTRAVAGFVVVRADEVEQIYVSAPWRGTEVAARLLAHAETTIAQRHQIAWLAVVAGNTRARRFYERGGWHDRGDYDNVAEVSSGTTIVPSRRYEKMVSAHAEEATP